MQQPFDKLRDRGRLTRYFLGYALFARSGADTLEIGAAVTAAKSASKAVFDVFWERKGENAARGSIFSPGVSHNIAKMLHVVRAFSLVMLHVVRTLQQPFDGSTALTNHGMLRVIFLLRDRNSAPVFFST